MIDKTLRTGAMSRIELRWSGMTPAFVRVSSSRVGSVHCRMRYCLMPTIVSFGHSCITSDLIRGKPIDSLPESKRASVI